MAISQASMVAVMTMTPVHMKLHGHETMSPYVISAHIGGMFAFSPLVGRYVDRRGPLSAVQTGAAILVAATLLASTAGISEWLLFPALWALGLGWNFGLLGGSAMLIESVDSAERVGVQGTADLTMSLCGAVAGFSSGFIRRAVGYHVLADVAAVAALGLLLAAYVTTRRSVPPARRRDSRAGGHRRRAGLSKDVAAGDWDTMVRRGDGSSVSDGGGAWRHVSHGFGCPLPRRGSRHHDVGVDSFLIDRHQVANREFAEFVAATGYRTVAERPLDPAGLSRRTSGEPRAGSMVFRMTAGPVDLRHLDQWWAWTPGAVVEPSRRGRQFGRRPRRSPGGARRLRGR